ncbi:MAG TPA: aromatic ring-hydroxylating dioxygenase subunit alpha [Bordetella sp.]
MSTNSITVFKGDTSRLKRMITVPDRMSPEGYRLELEKIFSRAWLPTLSVSDVPENGSYTVVDVPPKKTSVIVVRGNDGVVRAFQNVCRHRGDMLVHKGNGKTKQFVCGFHGWRYSTEGALAGVTDETQFPDIERDKLGLVPVNCEVWNDLVFLNFEKTPHVTLKEWLGGIWDEYSGYAEGREKVADHRVVLKANWNVAVNAFCEGYHNMYIHKYTVPDYQGGKGNPLRHRAYIEIGKRFGRYSAHANMDHKRTPAEAVLYGRSKGLFPSFPKTDPNTLTPGINPSRFGEWAFDIVHLFPHFVFNPTANSHQYMWFWPVDAEHVEIRVMSYMFKARNAADRLAQAYSKVRLREVLREDLATMEAASRMISTGALPCMVFSEQEMLIQNHYTIADEMTGRNEPSVDRYAKAAA